jgi:hypothetical protein
MYKKPIGRENSTKLRISGCRFFSWDDARCNTRAKPRTRLPTDKSMEKGPMMDEKCLPFFVSSIYSVSMSMMMCFAQ